jgi:fatty-acid desaturase
VTLVGAVVENMNMGFSKKFSVSTYFLAIVVPLHLLTAGFFYHLAEFRLIHIFFIFLVYLFVGGMGLEIGFHRLLSHKNFNLKSKSLENILYLLGAFAFQGSSLAWVALHRNHHSHVDTDSDHQSPRHGLWSSYIGWTVSSKLTEKIKPSSIRDLLRSPFHRALDKYYYLIVWSVTLSILLLFPVFFFTIYLPGILLSFHVSSVNNLIGHNQKIGKRPFIVSDWSTDVAWAALFSWGISYQNTHHHFPEEINYSKYSGGIDPGYYIYLSLKKLGLTENKNLL